MSNCTEPDCGAGVKLGAKTTRPRKKLTGAGAVYEESSLRALDVKA